jgi:hypothetical protein
MGIQRGRYTHQKGCEIYLNRYKPYSKVEKLWAPWNLENVLPFEVLNLLMLAAESFVGWTVARNGNDPINFTLQDWKALVGHLWLEWEEAKPAGWT